MNKSFESGAADASLTLNVPDPTDQASDILRQLRDARRQHEEHKQDPAQLALAEKDMLALIEARNEAARLQAMSNQSRATLQQELSSLQQVRKQQRSKIWEYQRLLPTVTKPELDAVSPSVPGPLQFIRAVQSRTEECKRITAVRKQLESDLKGFFSNEQESKRRRIKEVAQENEQLSAVINAVIVPDVSENAADSVVAAANKSK